MNMSKKEISKPEEIAYLNCINEMHKILDKLYKTPRKSFKNEEGGEINEQ